MQRCPVWKNAPSSAHAHRHVQVGVRKHDQRVLAAHLQLHLRAALAALARMPRPVATEPVKLIASMRASVTSFSPTTEPRPIDEVEHAGRDAGAVDDVGERPGAARHQLGRLDHDAIAVGQRRRDLPGRNRDREIPRRDEADHAERLARDLHVDAGPHRAEPLARHAQALLGEELEDVAGAADLAGRRRPASCLPRAPADRPVRRGGRRFPGRLSPAGRRAAAPWCAPRPGRRRGRPRSRRSTWAALARSYSPTTSEVSDGLMSATASVPCHHSPAIRLAWVMRLSFASELGDMRERLRA